MSKSSQKRSKLDSSKRDSDKRDSNKELRVLGIDDGHFNPEDEQCLLIAVLYRNKYVESVLSTKVAVDGLDATKKIADLVASAKCKPNAIMLQGITFAGFNVVDIKEIAKLTSLPVIIVSRKKPNFEEIKSALQNLSDPEARWNRIQSAGKIHKAGKIYYQSAGTDRAVEIIGATTVRGNMPEPVRLAHVIASGVVLGAVRSRT